MTMTSTCLLIVASSPSASNPDVSHETLRLLADAELAEDHVEQVLRIHPAGYPPDRSGRKPQIFGDQLQVVPIGVECLADKSPALLKRTTVTLARDQRLLRL